MPGMAAVSLFVFLGTVLIIAPLRMCFTSQPCCLSGLIFILYKCSHYKDLTWGEYKWEDACTLRTCLYRNCIDQRSGGVKHMPALTRSRLQRSNSFLSHRSGVTPRPWKQVSLTILLNWKRRCKLFPVIIVDHCCMAPRSSLQARQSSPMSDSTLYHYVKPYGGTESPKGAHVLSDGVSLAGNNFHKARTPLTSSDWPLAARLNHWPAGSGRVHPSGAAFAWWF